MDARLVPPVLGVVVGLALGTAAARAARWEDRLAREVSGRLRQIERELAEIEAALPPLPTIPLDDQGGSGGFASTHPQAEPPPGGRYAVTVKWEQAAAVDTVVLVPARRYDVGGLQPQHGTPDSFTVELLDEAGAVVARVGEERAVWAHPVRAGHPFLFRVAPPVQAAGLRVSAGRLQPDPDGASGHIHAWAEAYVFAGERNLAAGAAVAASGGLAPPAPWRWGNAFLVDGQTPLGLPELPAGEHRDIGWLSEGMEAADRPMWLELNLGAEKSFDAVRLFPAKRPTPDLPSGFGFPRHLKVAVAERPAAGNEAPPVVAEVEMPNPGHNPVLIPFERRQGQVLRIEATRLWKAFEKYPAFFALSEVEVLDGERNVARGAGVRSPNGMGTVIAPGARLWSTVSLCDGFGPDGRLVPVKEWLTALDRRLELETRRHRLRAEAREIVDRWHRTALTCFAVVGGAGALALVALPLGYRVRGRRELRKVRERIANDLHDEVGSNLGSIQMFADLAEGRAAPHDELKRIQRIAAETVSAVRDIVWLLRPTGAHRIGTVEHLRETSSIMLEPVEWEFSANEEAWQCELPDEASRHLFLFFREALHNALRHSGARRVTVRVERRARHFVLRVCDDGCGIAPERMERPATLRALRQRAEALRAELEVDTAPGGGTRLELRVPLDRARRK